MFVCVHVYVCVVMPVQVCPTEGVVHSKSTEPVKVKIRPRSSGEYFNSLKYRLKTRHHSGEWVGYAAINTQCTFT